MLPALTLQERVRQFNLGTPTAMHVGTHELVNDLWRELEKRLENHVVDSEQASEGRSSTAAHTPRPWFADAGRNDEGSPVIGIGPEADVVDCVIAEVRPATSHFTERDWANARLIAAAPDQNAVCNELHRLSLVIESAVRTADPKHHAAILVLIGENKAAIAAAVGDRPAAAQPQIQREPI